MTETEIAKIVVDVAFQVHKRFRAMAMAFGKSVVKGSSCTQETVVGVYATGRQEAGIVNQFRLGINA